MNITEKFEMNNLEKKAKKIMNNRNTITQLPPPIQNKLHSTADFSIRSLFKLQNLVKVEYISIQAREGHIFGKGRSQATRRTAASQQLTTYTFIISF